MHYILLLGLMDVHAARRHQRGLRNSRRGLVPSTMHACFVCHIAMQQAAVEAAVGPSPSSQLRPPGVPDRGFIPFYRECGSRPSMARLLGSWMRGLPLHSKFVGHGPL